MKKLTLLTLTLLLTALVQLTAPPVQAEVSIPDAELAAVIRETLGLPAGAAITADAMRNLTELEAAGRGIADLTGLEDAVNLTGLNLGILWIDNEGHVNPISNVSPLASLTNLAWLGLVGTDVSDVSALASLTKLETLDLRYTFVSDVSALAGLTNLAWLGLVGTDVSDVSALATLTNLRGLDLRNTDVSDIAALARLTQLKTLRLGSTDVSDIAALARLTNLAWLGLVGTDVSDVSALATLTNLAWLDLRSTFVSDVSALATLTNLVELYLTNCPLNAAAHQTHIPAIQANGTEVKFDPFKPIQLQRVPWLVSLIYFRPSDRPVRPNVDAEIDALIKETQRFFADQLELHGFERKTFQFETDAHGNAVVHHINGKFPNAHYQQSSFSYSWVDEIREQTYIPRRHIIVRMLDSDPDGRSFTGAAGTGSGGNSGGSVDIDSWHWGTLAHELAHAFGLYHDWRPDANAERIKKFTSDPMLTSFCAAEWLSVHPAFNPGQPVSTSGTTIEMLPPILASPPNTIRLRFEVTDRDGLHQAQLRIRDFGHSIRYGALIDCQRLTGVHDTVEFVTTALTPQIERVTLKVIERVTLKVIDVRGHRFARGFDIDVASLLATEEASQLVADVNGDGVINLADLAIVAQAMGKPVENPRADVNGDGVVDGEDFALVAAHLGEGEAAAPSQAALPARLTLEKVEWALNFLYAENTGSPAFRRGIAKLEGFLALLVPDKTVLLANYPNPFNPETWIPYQLSEAAEVTVTIHASDGKLVRTLELGQVPAGVYSDKDRAAYWDGRNAQGEPVASGVYFYTLTAGDFSATRKMVIRK